MARDETGGQGFTRAFNRPSLGTVPTSVASYPPWFVLACTTLAIVAGLWLLTKLLKLALWLALITALIGGAILVGWALIR